MFAIPLHPRIMQFGEIPQGILHIPFSTIYMPAAYSNLYASALLDQTAWYLCHRIRASMSAAECELPKLDGIVEIDETYVGGKPRKGSPNHKRGRGTKKEIVIGIRQRGGALRFFHAEDVKSGTLAKYIKENVSQDVDVVMTDDFSAYRKAVKNFGVLGEHKQINHSLGSYALGDIYTNGIESGFRAF